MKKHGFTLVELVVVLAVIAILTHLAVRELSHLRDAKLTKAADAQLETIRTSVFTPSGKRHIAQVADEEATGFLADMGRLPRLVDDMTLGELWTMPTNALPYAVRPATAENLVPGLSSLANTSVYVPTGWRGPYLRLPIGITNSSIHSCDIGDDCAIHNVHYLSHYIIGNRCMLFNIEEMCTTDHAKFGNGVIKDGEPEEVRVKIEVMNETGCRAVYPFDGMTTADAYMWAKYIDDEPLQQKLREITQASVDSHRGYYGTIGEGCVIKNSSIIKDAKIGAACYIKGASKLKNITINSSEKEPSQIGENVIMVNGIMGLGSRVFYSCTAIRFVIGNNSALKFSSATTPRFPAARSSTTSSSRRTSSTTTIPSWWPPASRARATWPPARPSVPTTTAAPTTTKWSPAAASGRACARASSIPASSPATRSSPRRPIRPSSTSRSRSPC